MYVQYFHAENMLEMLNIFKEMTNMKKEYEEILYTQLSVIK